MEKSKAQGTQNLVPIVPAVPIVQNVGLGFATKSQRRSTEEHRCVFLQYDDVFAVRKKIAYKRF